MSALDDKDVPSAEQWGSAVNFMTSAVKKEIKLAGETLDNLVGPKSFYDRWLRWKSQSEIEGKRQAIAEELIKFLNAEPVCLCLKMGYPLFPTDQHWFCGKGLFTLYTQHWHLL